MVKKYTYRLLIAFAIYFYFHANRSLDAAGIFNFVYHDLVYFFFISFVVMVIFEMVDWVMDHLYRTGCVFNNARTNWRAGIILTLVTFPFVAGASYFSFYVINPLIDCDCRMDTINAVYKDLMMGQVIAWLVVAARLIKANAEQAKVLERDNALVQKELLVSRFENLKNQINPHFLFNSFSVLQNLIENNPEKASVFLEKLSDMYRYILEKREESMSSIEKELEILNVYLYLMHTRHENSLQVSIKIDPEYHQKLVPTLALQMLIENAIKHNRFSIDEPLKIDIFIENEYLVVRNELRKKGSVASSTKIGLENIKHRYQLQTNIPVFIQESKHYFEVKLPTLSGLKLI